MTDFEIYFYRDCDNHPRYSFNDSVVEAICLFGLQVQKQIKTSPIKDCGLMGE